MIRPFKHIIHSLCRIPSVCCCIVLLMLNNSSFAQAPTVQFDVVGAEQGMEEANILCMYQDSRGFMWFGTNYGLKKYDGYTFTTYAATAGNNASLSNNFVQDITEDRNGDLWIATLGGGVCRFDRAKERFHSYRTDLVNKNTVSSDDVYALEADPSGNIWIGSNEGLDLLDIKTGVVTRKPMSADRATAAAEKHVQQLLVDSRGKLWIGTHKGGLKRLDLASGEITHYRHSRESQNAIASNNITAILEDRNNRLWIGTADDGLDMLDPTTGVFSHFRSKNDGTGLLSNEIRAVLKRDQQLWIGTENGGISVLDTEKGTFTNYTRQEVNRQSLVSNSINCLLKDTKGSIWIGTFNAGINLVDIDAGKFAHYYHIPTINSISNNKVLCFFENAAGKVWIGTDGGGLNLYDPATGKFSVFRHQPANKNSICGDNVLSVIEDSKGNVWIGTWGNGVSVYSPSTKSYRHYKNNPYDSSSLSSNNAWTIFEDRDRNIWIGTYGGGLNKFDPSTHSFTSFRYDENNEFTIGDNWVNSVNQDKNGNLWVCTSGGGLQLFDLKTQKFHRFQYQADANSIGNSNVNNVYIDKQDKLWIGTQGGLSMYDQHSKTFTNYTQADGLPGSSVFGILEDDNGNLWLSTDNGVSRFSRATKAFSNFTRGDGLQSQKFRENAFLKTSNGTFYFGGNNGFNVFSPSGIKSTAFDPPLVITRFQLFNRDVQVGEGTNSLSPLTKSITETNAVVLSHRETFFSFSFASLNYSVRDHRQYQYMMEGFDEQWHEVGANHTATYTNLDPGKYVFRVRGLNNEAQWSDNIKSISVTITPPYWRTWWFRITVILAVLAIATLFYLARLNAVKRREQILKRKVEEQTGQLTVLNAEERKARQEADHANDELEKKNRELEQFVYIASHDLREPLRTTTSFVTLLQKHYKGKIDAKADTYLSYINDASERMRTLINDLLEYSRIGNNKEVEEVNTSQLLQEVQTDLQVALSEAGATIKAESLPTIAAHRTAIKQLFQNLIANGIKFRKKDTAPHIDIRATKNEGSWKFSFTDNGIGIAEHHQKRIFDIFQRLHSRKEYEGSGIGLAHCRKIVELHRGEIWVESVPGQGSTFHFTISDNLK